MKQFVYIKMFFFKKIECTTERGKERREEKKAGRWGGREGRRKCIQAGNIC